MNDRIFILKLREMCATSAERSNAAGRSEERDVFNEVKTFIENYLSRTMTISEEAFIKRNGRTVLEVKVYPDGSNHEEKAVPAKKLLDYAVVAEREGRSHPVPMFATNEWLKGYETGRLDAIQDFRDEVCRALDIYNEKTKEEEKE